MSMTDDNPQPRMDGWASLSGALGSTRDKSHGTTFVRRARLPQETIDAMYEQNALIAKVVDKVVDDGLRRGWELEDVQDADGNPIDVDVRRIRSLCDDLRVTQTLRTTGKWARKDGGALIAVPVIDNKAASEQLVVDQRTPLRPWNPIPKVRVVPLEQDVGIFSATANRVLEYDVAGLVGSSIRIHHSRVIPMNAIDLSLESLQRHNDGGWGPSIIERIFDDFMRDGSSAAHAVAMMYVGSILYLKMDGYRQDANSKAGAAKIRKGLQEVQQNLEALGILGMDAADEIGNLTIQIAGSNDLVRLMGERFARSGNMPKEILFNESPAGLNAGQLSGPQEIWFSTVEQWQEQDATPVIDRALELIFAWLGIPAKSWRVAWNPLWSKSDEAAAALAKTNAETDAINIQAGVYTAEEVRDWRFVQGRTGPLELEAEQMPEALAIGPDDVEAQIAAQAPASAAPANVADEAMNGAQIASLLEIQARLNRGEITYPQAVGALGMAFPRSRGREAEILGPITDAPARPAPAAGPETDEAQASSAPMPDDVISVQEAATKFGVPTRTLTRAMQLGTLPYWGFGSRRQVSLADVLALGKAHEAPPPEEIVE